MTKNPLSTIFDTLNQENNAWKTLASLQSNEWQNQKNTTINCSWKNYKYRKQIQKPKTNCKTWLYSLHDRKNTYTQNFYLSIYLSGWLSTYLPTYLPNYLHTCLPTYLPLSASFLPSSLPTDWLTDWQTDGRTDPPTDRPTDLLTNQPTNRPTDWLTNQPTDQPNNQPMILVVEKISITLYRPL